MNIISRIIESAKKRLSGRNSATDPNWNVFSQRDAYRVLFFEDLLENVKDIDGTIVECVVG